MLFPTKHDHPDQTVMALASVMIKYLSRHEVVKYDALLEHCRKQGRVEYLFSPAVSLLYLLGLVDYLPKADAFEWKRKTVA
jgi:hypothetical protein